jgi:hypothetical protein
MSGRRVRKMRMTRNWKRRKGGRTSRSRRIVRKIRRRNKNKEK